MRRSLFPLCFSARLLVEELQDFLPGSRTHGLLRESATVSLAAQTSLFQLQSPYIPVAGGRSDGWNAGAATTASSTFVHYSASIEGAPSSSSLSKDLRTRVAEFDLLSVERFFAFLAKFCPPFGRCALRDLKKSAGAMADHSNGTTNGTVPGSPAKPPPSPSPLRTSKLVKVRLEDTRSSRPQLPPMCEFLFVICSGVYFHRHLMLDHNNALCTKHF